MDVVERLTLETASEHTLIATEHRQRYELARELAGGLRVLDLACGTGYGAAILGETARSVVGVDNDVATVEVAAATVGRAGHLSFRAADALATLQDPETAHEFDAVICFEGLEHLPEPGAALMALRTLAEQGMKLVVSVPNSRLFAEDNPFHVTDFSWSRAREAFSGFPDTIMLPQFLAEGSLILPRGATQTRVELVLEDRAAPDAANHFIFCTGWEDEQVGGAHRGRMLLEAAPVHNRYLRDLERANRELWRTNARLGRGNLARTGSAAPSYLVKIEARVAAAEARAAVWKRRAERVAVRVEPGIRVARRVKRVARSVSKER